MVRQYVKDSLYDRISTRPFLLNIEKKWIAFQLLLAIQQAHKHGICHGDIKLENVMITSWNWVLLTDFASFKPTYLPEDNPADYNYFFDTSRRRTCYVAPERFKSRVLNEATDKDINTTSTTKSSEVMIKQGMASSQFLPNPELPKIFYHVNPLFFPTDIDATTSIVFVFFITRCTMRSIAMVPIIRIPPPASPLSFPIPI